MTVNDIESTIKKQRHYFSSQQTKSVPYRKQLLKTLRAEIKQRENAIYEALYKDFKKSTFEAYATEIGIVLSELDLTISKLQAWSKPEKVRASLLNFPSTDYIYNDPYGTILIIAPWNYPFQLALAPMISAIAAGNTAVLKPSELTPHTSGLLSEIIKAVFKEEHAIVIEGGVEVSQNLLKQRWDYIFFTGSVYVGKIIAKAAAEYMTPVTLELGGKNPCIIDETANIPLAAKRITWGKFLNAGQTCIAPDYVLIKETTKQQFIDCLKTEIEKAYTQNQEASDDYPRIINEKNFDRLKNMLQNENIAFGGKLNREDLFISPTLIDNPKLDSEVMKDEIFGPILPIISYTSDKELNEIINTYEKPLSLYVFSKSKSFTEKILKTFSFGGGTINDTVAHFVNHRLPFGGIGNSGIGAYHGKLSYDTFSHKKAMSKRANWLDLPFRYAPYKGKLNLIKKTLKYLG